MPDESQSVVQIYIFTSVQLKGQKLSLKISFHTRTKLDAILTDSRELIIGCAGAVS